MFRFGKHLPCWSVYLLNDLPLEGSEKSVSLSAEIKSCGINILEMSSHFQNVTKKAQVTEKDTTEYFFSLFFFFIIMKQYFEKDISVKDKSSKLSLKTEGKKENLH